jgi:murein DD-endopeptidase MepM/ murein hydrolase activator NlpD
MSHVQARQRQPVLRSFPLLISLLIAAACTSARALPAQPWSVQWEPAKLVNGSPVLLRVTAPGQITELHGNFLEQELSFRFSKACHCWYTIAGVNLDTKPGQYTLQLDGKDPTGDTTFSQELTVGAANYPSTTLKVPPEFVEPPKETLARIDEDQEIKKHAFSATIPEALWSGAFPPPAQAAVSGGFGSARMFNGTKKSQHTGLDFRVPTGTPVHAANNGTVILARSLYFEGNCVMIDHGQGLITLYMHLSEIKVKEGDKVQTGQLLGLSGGTGRATAPHLHFAVRWHGEYLDPRTLLQLHPPGK